MPGNYLPFISICIPTYNKVNYVERLLHSIKVQTYKNIEVLIADNSEGEDIAVLAAKYRDELPGLVYKKNNPAVEMAGNHNEVTNMARGEWVKIMHSDDWFAHPASLRIFAEAAVSQEKAFFIFSAYTEIKKGAPKEKTHFATNKQLATLKSDALCLFNDNFIGHPSTMMHKNTKDIFYDKNYKWVVDIDFYMRFLFRYKEFHFIKDASINIGINDLQESAACNNHADIEIPEYFNLLNKYSLEKINNIHVFYAFWKLVKKFKIISPVEVHRAGYKGKIPPAIIEIIHFQLKIPRIILKQTPLSRWLMKKCFTNTKHKTKNSKLKNLS